MRTLLCLLFLAVPAQAGTISEAFSGFVEETKLTILESAIPSYFYDLKEGKSRGGVITHVITHREFISLDAGWYHTMQAKDVGVAVMGGSLHTDRFFEKVFPKMVVAIRSLVPRTMADFWTRLRFGVYTGYDFDKGGLTAGLSSGIELRF